VSFLGLKKIDDVEQSFKAEILYECLIKNGQLDDSLMVESKAFCYPYPSAMWIWFAQVSIFVFFGFFSGQYLRYIVGEVLSMPTVAPGSCAQKQKPGDI